METPSGNSSENSSKLSYPEYINLKSEMENFEFDPTGDISSQIDFVNAKFKSLCLEKDKRDVFNKIKKINEIISEKLKIILMENNCIPKNTIISIYTGPTNCIKNPLCYEESSDLINNSLRNECFMQNIPFHNRKFYKLSKKNLYTPVMKLIIKELKKKYLFDIYFIRNKFGGSYIFFVFKFNVDVTNS